jgi:hypothetical protein
VLLASCSTTEKFYVHATPGTKIYSPSRPSIPLTTIPNSGKAKIIVPSDAYYGYLLAEYPGQNISIPFGLDTKSKSTAGVQTVEGLGYVLTTVGIGAMITGVVMTICNSEDSEGAVIAGIGGGVGALGAGFGASAGSRNHQLNYKYHYTYQAHQNALEMGTEPLLNRDPTKSETATAAQQSSQRHKATSSTSQATRKSNSTQGSAARTRSDYAENIQGSYVGTGLLQRLNTVEERYSNVKIILERIDKTHVKVIYYESGEEYFESPDTYEITHNSDGSYTLVIPTIPSATIKINKNGKLTYTHNKVLIDGDTYTLKATTERQKR